MSGVYPAITSPKPWLRHWSFSTDDIFHDPIVRDTHTKKNEGCPQCPATKLLYTVIIHAWPTFGSFCCLGLCLVVSWLLFYSCISYGLSALAGHQPGGSAAMGMHANMNKYRIRTRSSQPSSTFCQVPNYLWYNMQPSAYVLFCMPVNVWDSLNHALHGRAE